MKNSKIRIKTDLFFALNEASLATHCLFAMIIATLIAVALIFSIFSFDFQKNSISLNTPSIINTISGTGVSFNILYTLLNDIYR